MEVTVEIHDKSFNVNIASKPGAEAFMSIKGCRIANGSKGEFVSWPSTKNESSGKWWSHVWANDKFGAVVLSKYHEATKKPGKASQDDDQDIPY